MLVALVTGASLAEEKPLHDLFNVADATELVFVDLESAVDGSFEYSQRGMPIKIEGDLRRVLQQLDKKPVGDPGAPFIGYLGQVAVRNKQGKITCILGVINWDATFSVSDAIENGGKIVEGKRDICVEGSSTEFARWMYEYLKKSYPKEIETMTKRYEKGGHTLSELLFGKEDKTKSQQGGTGQPATRPESKLLGSDKPQPEAEGRSR